MAEPRVIRLDVAYDGTDFQGFSVQPGRRTVQGAIEAAWKSIAGETLRVTAAGRTDTGVHALGQVVSLRTSTALSTEILARALNAKLPRDIAVLSVSDMPTAFDARRSARLRRYRYTIWTGSVRHVRWQRYSWHMPRPLDMDGIQACSSLLVGSRDFAGFAARMARSSVRSTWRTVVSAEWTIDTDGFVHFDIAANGFLRRMVRGIVGALVDVGQGRKDADDIRGLLSNGSPKGRLDHAPAHGLTLTRVEYE